MKLSCLRGELKQALSIVSRAANPKSMLPICSAILLTTDEGRLRLAATNLTMGITVSLGAKIIEDGSAAVPAKLLSDVISTLSEETVSMEVSKQTLNLRCGAFKTSIKGYDPTNFPPVALVTDSPLAQIELGRLKTAIVQTSVSVAVDTIRPVLEGIYTKFAGNEATLAAVDGFQLTVCTLALVSAVAEEAAFLVPGKNMRELVRVLPDDVELVEIVAQAEKNQIAFRAGDVQLSSQLVAGTFPNYPVVIPQSFRGRICVQVDAFKQAVRAANLFAAQSESGALRLLPLDQDEGYTKMRVMASGDETGDCVAEVGIRAEGEPTQIGLSSKLLSAILSVFKTGEISMQTNEVGTSVAFRQVGNDSWLHVLMPMILRWGESENTKDEPEDVRLRRFGAPALPGLEE